MGGRAPQIHSMSTDERRAVSVDFSAQLSSDEVLVGTPVVQCDVALLVEDAQVNTDVVQINGVSVVAGKAVLFVVSSDDAGRYPVEVLCNSDAGQRIEGQIQINIQRSRF